MITLDLRFRDFPSRSRRVVNQSVQPEEETRVDCSEEPRLRGDEQRACRRQKIIFVLIY